MFSRIAIYQPAAVKILRIFVLLGMLLLASPLQVSAQEEEVPVVQELQGNLSPGESHFYLLPNLKAGDRLFVHAEGLSGNLDPAVGLFDTSTSVARIRDSYQTDVEQVIASGEDPLVALPDIIDRYFLVWDDDSAQGYDAAFEYLIPEDGSYRLLVTRSVGKNSFGEYRLLIGLNAPEVVTGDAVPTDDVVAIFDKEGSLYGTAVQEVTGSLSADKSSTFYTINPVIPGDTLYVYLERTSGNLRPAIYLRDFGNKALRSGNHSAEAANASLTYTFDNEVTNFKLDIVAGCCEGEQPTNGNYRLLVGINEPEVLQGQAESFGLPVLELPTPVEIGIKLQQIAGVDQKAENFDVVASLAMKWLDPDLAFRPDSCNCVFKTYTSERFSEFVRDAQGRWPEFTIFNQQGNRWDQNKIAVVHSEGVATYFERFSATMQAPDFDFRKFPFDTQQFYIRVDQLYPEDFYIFSDWVGYSEFGDQLGEEEWYITDFNTEITSEQVSMESITSRFSFRIEVRRHLDYYIFRFFIPIGLILTVGWITFFLKDYGKRVDVTAGNLLAFIAYNFTIANDLPRLGYMTFMDAILTATFVVSVFILVYNVVLKRMELIGKGERAQRIDAVMIWAYPLAYAGAIAAVVWFFFLRVA